MPTVQDACSLTSVKYPMRNVCRKTLCAIKKVANDILSIDLLSSSLGFPRKSGHCGVARGLKKGVQTSPNSERIGRDTDTNWAWGFKAAGTCHMAACNTQYQAAPAAANFPCCRVLFNRDPKMRTTSKGVLSFVSRAGLAIPGLTQPSFRGGMVDDQAHEGGEVHPLQNLRQVA